MTNYFKISKRIHWTVMFCFLLPFFHYSGCITAEEKEATIEAEKQFYLDSIAAVQAAELEFHNADTSQRAIYNADSTTNGDIHSNAIPESKIRLEVKSEPGIFSEDISKKYYMLQPFLNPIPNYYTGIASFIDSLVFLFGILLFLSLLFLTIGLIIKYIDKEARKAIALLNILALISFFFTHLFKWLEGLEVLWGYWFTLTLLGVLTVYDLYVIRQIKNNK